MAININKTSSLPMSGTFTHSSPQFKVTYNVTVGGKVTLTIGSTSGTFGYKFSVRVRVGSEDNGTVLSANGITSSTNESKTFTVDTSEVIRVAVRCYAPSCTDGVTSWTQIAKYTPPSVEEEKYTAISNATISVSGCDHQSVVLKPNWSTGSVASVGTIYIFDANGNLVITSDEISQSDKNKNYTFTGLSPSSNYTATLVVDDEETYINAATAFTTSASYAYVNIEIVSGKSVQFSCGWTPISGYGYYTSISINDYYANDGTTTISYTITDTSISSTTINTDSYQNAEYKDRLEPGHTYCIQLNEYKLYYDADGFLVSEVYASASALFTTLQLSAYDIVPTTNGVSFTTSSNKSDHFYWAIVQNQGDENADSFKGWNLCYNGSAGSWTNLVNGINYYIVLWNTDPDTKTYIQFTTKNLSVAINGITKGENWVSGTVKIFSDNDVHTFASISKVYVEDNSSTSQVSTIDGDKITVSGLNDEEYSYLCVDVTDGFNKATNKVHFRIVSGYVYVWNGSKWLKTKPYVWDGTKWRRTIPYVWNGTGWKRISK